MKDIIAAIISDGIQAPSGENCQPWKFLVRKDGIMELFLLPDRDQSLYSWGQRASYMANGALLENVVISAKHYGFEARVHLFPDQQNLHLIARIELVKTSAQTDPLYFGIRERATNRKPYKNYCLNGEEITALRSCSDSNHNIRIQLVQDLKRLKILGSAGSINENVMLSNEYLHKFFFSHVNWTKEEDEMKKIGFFIDTLELPPPARFGFRMLRNWSLMRILKMFGFHKLVGLQNARVNSRASAIGIISIDDISPEKFIFAGRTMQRLWLTATKFHLSIQPLTGVLFFMHNVRARETEHFTTDQIHKIENAYDSIQKAFNIDPKETAVFMFRIGKGDKPTARSVRFALSEVVEFL
jgi:hypothetical protein